MNNSNPKIIQKEKDRAEALRRNLSRRKEQKRGRQVSDEEKDLLKGGNSKANDKN